MANYGTGSSFGVLLQTGTPADTVYIQADGLGLTVPVSAQTFPSPFASAPVVVFSKRHTHSGTISGQLMDADILGTTAGTIITAKQWAQRLLDLITGQGSLTISLTSKPFQAVSVAFPGDYTLEPELGGQSLYNVSLPWVEVG